MNFYLLDLGIQAVYRYLNGDYTSEELINFLDFLKRHLELPIDYDEEE